MCVPQLPEWQGIAGAPVDGAVAQEEEKRVAEAAGGSAAQRALVHPLDRRRLGRLVVLQPPDICNARSTARARERTH